LSNINSKIRLPSGQPLSAQIQALPHFRLGELDQTNKKDATDNPIVYSAFAI